MQIILDLLAGKTLQSATGTATAGNLVITDGSSTLVSIPLSATAGTLSAGVITLTVPLSGTATGSGTASAAYFTNNSGTTVGSGLSVGTSGADINLTQLAIYVNGLVTVTSGSITHG